MAKITDSVEDVRSAGLLLILKPSVLLIIFRQPGANIIETVDRIRAAIPQLKTEIPAGIDVHVVVDRSSTIRSSVRDVEMTLMLSIGLVILVVFLFLRNGRRDVHSQRRRASLSHRHVWRDVSLRLQYRQSFADGAHDFHRFRGR